MHLQNILNDTSINLRFPCMELYSGKIMRGWPHGNALQPYVPLSSPHYTWQVMYGAQNENKLLSKSRKTLINEGMVTQIAGGVLLRKCHFNFCLQDPTQLGQKMCMAVSVTFKYTSSFHFWDVLSLLAFSFLCLLEIIQNNCPNQFTLRLVKVTKTLYMTRQPEKVLGE